MARDAFAKPDVPDPCQRKAGGRDRGHGRWEDLCQGYRVGVFRAAAPWQEWLRRAEQLAAGEARSVLRPAWLRKTPGERRWPVTLSVAVAIVLQVLLPPDFTRPLPPALLPALEGALLV